MFLARAFHTRFIPVSYPLQAILAAEGFPTHFGPRLSASVRHICVCARSRARAHAHKHMCGCACAHVRGRARALVRTRAHAGAQTCLCACTGARACACGIPTTIARENLPVGVHACCVSCIARIYKEEDEGEQKQEGVRKGEGCVFIVFCCVWSNRLVQIH